MAAVAAAAALLCAVIVVTFCQFSAAAAAARRSLAPYGTETVALAAIYSLAYCTREERNGGLLRC